MELIEVKKELEELKKKNIDPCSNNSQVLNCNTNCIDIFFSIWVSKDYESYDLIKLGKIAIMTHNSI